MKLGKVGAGTAFAVLLWGLGASSARALEGVVQLDWRKVAFPPLEYWRQPLPDGAALVLFPQKDSHRARADIVFPTSLSSLSVREREIFPFVKELWLMGGAGDRGAEEMSAYTKGSRVSLSLGFVGQKVTLGCEGLAEDASRCLGILDDVLRRPRFEETYTRSALKAQAAFLDEAREAASTNLHRSWLGLERGRVVWGELSPGHSLRDAAIVTKRPPTEAEARALVARIVNRAGSMAVLSGKFEADAERGFIALANRLPRRPLPGEVVPVASPALPKENLAHAVQKKGNEQAQVFLSAVCRKLPDAGPFEALAGDILENAFEKRFEQALRQESGHSYAPDAGMVEPSWPANTAVVMWQMSFQASNARLADAIRTAHEAWASFAAKGISTAELEEARASLINSELNVERGTSDVAADLVRDLARGSMPFPLTRERRLSRLETIRNSGEVNAVLRRMLEGGAPLVLSVFGDVGEEKLKELAKIVKGRSVRHVTLEKALEELSAP